MTVHAAPRRQSFRLANPIATEASKPIESNPVTGQNCAGPYTPTGAQPVQNPDGVTKL